MSTHAARGSAAHSAVHAFFPSRHDPFAAKAQFFARFGRTRAHARRPERHPAENILQGERKHGAERSRYEGDARRSGGERAHSAKRRGRHIRALLLATFQREINPQ